MNTATMMQLGLCFMVMLVVVNALNNTAADPGNTTAAPGDGAATFTGSGYITLIASVMALLYQLL